MDGKKYSLNLRVVLVILTGLLAAVGVLRLVMWVTESAVIPLDHAISLVVQRGLSTSGWLMETISLLGFTPVSQVLMLLVAAGLWVAGMRRAAVVSVMILASGLVSYAAKVWINRPRPTDDLVTVVRHLDDPSFPSGHVIMYTVLFGFVIFVMVMNRRVSWALRGTVGAVSVFMVLTVGISRIYLGVHWMTDVMGGYLIGLSILSVLIAIHGSKGIFPRLVDK